jgi:hypothetical protein
VIIRQYKDEDLDSIEALHEKSGLKYSLPDMETFFSRRVVDDAGKIGMVSLLKLTAEAYLICDPEWRNPAWRMNALQSIHAVCNEDARQEGVIEAVAFIPPAIEKTFRRRLERMGWNRNKPSWHSYWKAVL